MSKVIAIEKRKGGHLAAEREGVKWVCEVFVIDKTNVFSLDSLEDIGRARATPDERAIFQAGTNIGW